MKKKIFIIIAVLVSVLAIGAMIFASIKLNNQQKEQDKHLVEISLEELKEKVANKETFPLVFTQSNCAHCASFKPKFKRILAKYDIYGYEIVINTLSSKEKAELKDIANTEGSGTPTTVFIKNGEEERISTRLVGNQSEVDVEKKLKQLGYIK